MTATMSAEAASSVILRLCQLSLCKCAKLACTCTKWLNIIITLWLILLTRMSLGFNQKHAYRNKVLILIFCPCTQHFFHTFHSWVPWIRSSFNTQFISSLSAFCRYIIIIMYCTYAAVSECNITPYVNNLFTFSKSVYYI